MNGIRTGLIYGSAREGRFCDTVAEWVMEEVARVGGFALSPIDPQALWGAVPPGPHTPADRRAVLREQIGACDAFIVISPEYNHGYTSELKFMIDSAYEEWHAKPVAFVSYGGISGGIRAVEQLRQVFAELHAVTMRDAVSLANPWTRLDGEGRLDEAGARKAMASMLAHLGWWATTLRDAREAAPYAELCA